MINCWWFGTPWKSSILCRHNLFTRTETLYFPVYKPIAISHFVGDPPFGGGVELGGRVWYPLKVLHIRHNLFAGTETPYLSVYEPIARRVLWVGVSLFWERGWARDRVVYHVKVYHITHALFARTDTLSLSVYDLRANRHAGFVWGERGRRIPFGGGGWTRRSSVVPRDSPPY